MRKRFLLISTIIVLSAFTFAACGKKSPSSPESTNSETTTAEPTTEENTEIGDLCMTVLHMCCMQLTAHTFPELLITLTKKGLIL